MTTFQRFVNAVIAYAGSGSPPVGLILPAVLTQETLIVAVLNYLRGIETPSPSPPSIGVVCLSESCSKVQFANVVARAEQLQYSQWVAALMASVPQAPGVAIAPIASMRTTSSGKSDGALTSIVRIHFRPWHCATDSALRSR